MPQFRRQPDLMFVEWDFLDRFAAAADHGFQAVEVQFPYDFPPEAIRERLEGARLTLVLINAPPGDSAAGERGLGGAARTGPREFRASHRAGEDLRRDVTGAKCVHVMAGRRRPARPGGACQPISTRCASRSSARRARQCLIEPLNPRDMPGYFLADFDGSPAHRSPRSGAG